MGAARSVWNAAQHPHGFHGQWASTGSSGGKHRAVNRVKVDREGERRAFNRNVKRARSGVEVRQQKAAVTAKVRKQVGEGSSMKSEVQPNGQRWSVPVRVPQRKMRSLIASVAKSTTGLGKAGYQAKRRTKTTFTGKTMRIR